jgi:sec-independent protein translocase protein TatA
LLDALFAGPLQLGSRRPYTMVSLSALLIGSLGPMELVVILAVAVLLFGGKKIPEVAKGLGEGIRNFKNALKADEKPEETKKQA